MNEGPAAMYYGGKTYLTFSASYCWTTSYQLGLLTYKGSGDPLLAASWTKSGPVFSSGNGSRFFCLCWVGLSGADWVQIWDRGIMGFSSVRMVRRFGMCIMLLRCLRGLVMGIGILWRRRLTGTRIIRRTLGRRWRCRPRLLGRLESSGSGQLIGSCNASTRFSCKSINYMNLANYEMSHAHYYKIQPHM